MQTYLNSIEQNNDQETLFRSLFDFENLKKKRIKQNNFTIHQNVQGYTYILHA